MMATTVSLREYIEQHELNPEGNIKLDQLEYYGDPRLFHETETSAFFTDPYNRHTTAIAHWPTHSRIWSYEEIFYTDLTHDEAIVLLGKSAIDAVERENCEPTGRLLNEADTTIEYMASISVAIGNKTYRLLAFYYPDESEFYDANGDLIEDLSNIDWQIDHYQIRD